MPSPPARQGRIQEQDGPAIRNYYGEAGSAGMRFSERWTQLRTRQSASGTIVRALLVGRNWHTSHHWPRPCRHEYPALRRRSVAASMITRPLCTARDAVGG
jgi:hypothetical protein